MKKKEFFFFSNGLFFLCMAVLLFFFPMWAFAFFTVKKGAAFCCAFNCLRLILWWSRFLLIAYMKTHM